MRLHIEGFKILAVVAAINLIIVVLAFIFSQKWCVRTPALLLLICSCIAILFFFRYPKREVNHLENGVISPADGEVVMVEEVYMDEYLNEKRMQVSIFMSIYNVHVNFYPISGIVRYYKYHEGKYLVAWHPKSSEKNEHTTVVVDNNGLLIAFRQIAGYVARRIVSYAKEGESVEQGQETGIIRFGSRVDLFLPLDAEIKVKVGDKVRAQRSVIAICEE